MGPRLPETSAADIVAAMAKFDTTMRASYNFRQNKFVVRHNGADYPPKVLISLATGLSTREFSGGQESNRYLTKRGFTVVPNVK